MLVVENSAMTIISKRNPFELTMSVSEKIAIEFRTDPASVVLSAWLTWLCLLLNLLRQTRLLLFRVDGHYLEVPSGAVYYIYSVLGYVYSSVILFLPCIISGLKIKMFLWWVNNLENIQPIITDRKRR